jgi:hypothetical protein
MQKMRTEYVNPVAYCDVSKFAAAGITACIVGKIYIFHRDFGEVHYGHICHIVKERGLGQNEMVSRMWLGEVKKPGSSIATYVGNTYLYRYFSMPHRWALDVWAHMIQEMGCVVNLLPHFRQEELSRLNGRSPMGQMAEEEVDYPEEDSMYSQSQSQHSAPKSGKPSREGLANLLDAASESSAGGARGRGQQQRTLGKHASFETADASLEPIKLTGGQHAEEKSQAQGEVEIRSSTRSQVSGPKVRYRDEGGDDAADSGDENSRGGSTVSSSSRRVGRGVGI